MKVESANNISSIMNSNVYTLNPYVTVDTTDAIEKATGLKGPHVIFNGVNVHIQSGAGSTYASPTNGLGNLVIGYNEPRMTINNNPSSPDLTGRGGSHNLVVGSNHQYWGYGGFLAGFQNETHGRFSTVTGGEYNTAGDQSCSVSGGYSNAALGADASVSGGANNVANGDASSVSGGAHNKAGGTGYYPEASSVSGGWGNTTSGPGSSISGGISNSIKDANYSSISGGSSNSIYGWYSSISGGSFNKINSYYSNISGGNGVTGNTNYGWAAGTLQSP